MLHHGGVAMVLHHGGVLESDAAPRIRTSGTSGISGKWTHR